MAFEDLNLSNRSRGDTNHVDEKTTIRRYYENSQETDRHLVSYEHFLGFSALEMKGKEVLDIGSGPGETFAKEAALIGISVFSMSPGLKNGITLNHAEEGLLDDWSKKSLAGRAQEMPFKDEAFDYEVALYSLPFYLPIGEGNSEYLNEILRTLKPKGKAYFYPAHSSDSNLVRALNELSEKINYKFEVVEEGTEFTDLERLTIEKK
jgi:ubiquinone/menaquinone biosynthesis C-methylase UbiE